MKVNPVWKKWKEQQTGAPATTVASPTQALPVVTNMEDHEQISEASVAAGGGEVALAEATNAAIEIMQEPEICVEAGMTPDNMVLFSKLNVWSICCSNESSHGMVPSSELSARVRCPMAVDSCPSSLGISPDKLLPLSSSSPRFVRSPISVGMVPDN